MTAQPMPTGDHEPRPHPGHIQPVGPQAIQRKGLVLKYETTGPVTPATIDAVISRWRDRDWTD